jgi:diacylglycerol kinase
MDRLKRRYVKTLLKFRYAARGLTFCFKTQSSLRWEILLGLLAATLGFALRISLDEWSVLSITMALVFSVEILNTAIERVCDFVSPDRNRAIGLIKDISAAAVSVICLAAVVEGLIIFLPRIWELIY